MPRGSPSFQHVMDESAEKFDVMYFDDGYGWQKLYASQVQALLDLRMQVELMLDEGGEMCFTDLIRHSQELEKTFIAVVDRLKIKKPK